MGTLKRRLQRAQARIVPPDRVPLHDGGELVLGPDGRINAYLDLFDAHDRAHEQDGEGADPRPYVRDQFLLAVLADEVDVERALQRDKSLGEFVHLMRCLTASVRNGDVGGEG